MEPALPNGMDLDEANPILVYGNETVHERLVRDDSMDEIVWRALFVKGGEDRRGGQREIWNSNKEIQVSLEVLYKLIEDNCFVEELLCKLNDKDKLPTHPEITHNTQISFKDALAQPLRAIAKRIKEGFTRLQTDETYRACHVAASMSTTKGAKLSLYCGTSSLLVSPRFLQRMGVNITSEIKHDFGAMPRCWFYAISHGSKTVIAADIFLPLPNLTAEMTRRVVLEECKGTPLEYLFHQPNVSQ